MKSLKYHLGDRLIYLEDSDLYLEVDNETNSFNVILNDFSQNELLNVNAYIIGPYLIDFSQKDNIMIKAICKNKELIEKFKYIITKEYIIPDENTSIIGKIKEKDLIELSTLLNYTFKYVANTIDFSLQEFISMEDFIWQYNECVLGDSSILYIKDKELLSKLIAIKDFSTGCAFILLMQFLLSKIEKLKDTDYYYKFVRNVNIGYMKIEFKDIESYKEEDINSNYVTLDFKSKDVENKEKKEEEKLEEEYEYEYGSEDFEEY